MNRGGFQRGGRGGFTGGRGGNAQRGRRGWKDWGQVSPVLGAVGAHTDAVFTSQTVRVKLPLRSLQNGKCSRRSSSTVYLSCGSKWMNPKNCASLSSLR